jgi:type IV pilus assembly protein PilM
MRNNRFFTLYIDATSIKLLVMKGKTVSAWAVLSLEPGLMKDGVITDTDKLANELKEFLRFHHVEGKKTIVGLSGTHCFYRVMTLPVLKADILNEAVQREAEGLLPVALDELYTSWQILSRSKTELTIFFVAYPRNATDALLTTLQKAETKPHSMDLAPLALARVTDRDTAVIMDVRPSEADIVIMVKGVPELIRSLPLPADNASPEDRLAIVRDELQRTIKFYNSSKVDSPLAEDAPIYVTGEASSYLETHPSFLEDTGHQVLPLKSPLPSLDGFNDTHYMVNIGLALKSIRLSKRQEVLVTNLNIIPAVYLPKPKSLAKMFIIPVLLLGIGLSYMMLKQVQDTAAENALIESQLNAASKTLEKRQAERRKLREEISKLEKEVSLLEKTKKKVSAAEKAFPVRHEVINGNLAVAMESRPEQVSNTLISCSLDLLKLEGTSPTEAEILLYADTLQRSNRFSDLIIDVVERIVEQVPEEETGGEEESGGEETGGEEETTIEYMEFKLILESRR